MAKLTISDIARMANVSTATVSFVLNGRPGICDETRSRVQAIIDETGYKPNVHTRRLTLRKSMTVHVVMRQYQYTLFNFFSLEVLMGIFRESRRLGYNIIFTSVDFTASDARSNFDYVIDTVRTGDADGVIFIQAADPAVVTTLQNEHFPFLCVDSHVKKDGSIPLLEMDYYDASYRATQYLIDNVHTDIGFIGADAAMEYHLSTFGGYTAALRDAGLVCHPEWVQIDAVEESPLPGRLENILACKKRPTAVFCAGDIFAIDAIKCAKRAGLRIPEDMSFMSIDGLVVSDFIEPPLSTMALDKAAMGANAMQLLYAIMNGRPYEAVNLMKTHIVRRQTVKRL